MSLDRLNAALSDPRLDPWLARGLRVWTRLRGAVPLERCLRLPSSARAYARAERDYWLRVACGHCITVAELHREIEGTVWRLRIWRERGVPDRATPLQVAIFNAFELGAPVPTVRQLQRIVGRSACDPMSGHPEETVSSY